MICPKCGEEYEGKKCPRCEGPEIIVNNDEYLRRRKAYEEKQAGEKSASSDIEQSEQTDKEETAEEKAAKAVIEGMKKAGEMAKSAVASNPGRVKKTALLVGATAAVVIVIVAIAVFVTGLISANRGTVYYTKDGKLYEVGADDAKQIGEADNVIFCHNYRNFFETDIPAEVSEKSVSGRMASDKGEYFAAAVYDENKLLYCLYVWNNKECVQAAESSGQMTIINVENDGRVIYKETEVVNDEGGTGNTALYVYNMNDRASVKVEDNAKRIYMYAACSMLVYLNGDNVLYTYDYSKAKEPEMVAEAADSIYMESDSDKDCYTYKAAVVNASSDAKGFIYNSGGECYYHKINGGEDLHLGRADGAGVEFIYKENKFVYMVSSSVLSFAAIKGGNIGEYKKIAALGTNSNVVYISDLKTLLCVDNSSALLKVKSGKVQAIADEVDDGSLARVVNSKKAYTYTSGQARYYAQSVQKKAVQLIDMETPGRENSQEVIFCKNKLYFSNGSGELIRCALDSEKAENLGNVERFWVVRQP